MNLIIVQDYAALSLAAADQITGLTAHKPDAAIMLPTGNTPEGTYQELVARKGRGQFQPGQLRLFQLDEYKGLGQDHPHSFYGWLKRICFQPLAVPDHNVVRLRGDALDLEAECRDYDQAILNVGGIDLCMAGLGVNGHLGFNEPPAEPDAPTRCVTLCQTTIDSNGAYWGGRDKVPPQAVTAGLVQLFAARKFLLLVSGQHKRKILKRVLEGPVTPDVPASYLQRLNNVTVIADRAAAP